MTSLISLTDQAGPADMYLKNTQDGFKFFFPDLENEGLKGSLAQSVEHATLDLRVVRVDIEIT